MAQQQLVMRQLKKLNMILNVLSVLYPKTSNSLKVIAAICILRKAVSVLISIYKTCLRPRHNFQKRYGIGSWALVTGSSDGIGKAIAFELARAGFNIVLSARTQSKLEGAKLELQDQFPKIEVRLLAVDYSSSGQPCFLQQKMSDLENVDISILVNNVGVDVLDRYDNLSEQQIINLVNLNCFAMSLLSRIFISRFQKRPLRSAIVNVSSLAGEIPMALHNIYSASKAFSDFLSRSLSYEYEEYIDIISLRPSEVSTPMTLNKKTDLMTIMPQDCAQGLLNDLGHERVTNGHWSHSLQGTLYHLVPESLFNHVFLNWMGPIFIKERKAATRKDCQGNR